MVDLFDVTEIGGSMWLESTFLRDVDAIVLIVHARVTVLDSWEQAGNHRLLDQVSFSGLLNNPILLFIFSD